MLASVARRAASLGVLGVILLAGCGGKSPDLAEVEGTLLWRDEPLENVLVEFIPDEANQPRSTGVTDAAGHFFLECTDGEPGAVVGGHRVVLTQAGRTEPGDGRRDPRRNANAGGKSSGETAPAVNLQILAPYGSPVKTSLRQQVQPGNQTIKISLP